jgi:hypothetical protein
MEFMSMFWDSVTAGLKILGFWQTYVVALGMTVIVVFPKLYLALLPDRFMYGADVPLSPTVIWYLIRHRCPSRYRGPLVFRFLSIRHMIVLASAWRREINGGFFFCDCVRQKCRRHKCDQHAGSLHVAARLVTALADAKQKNAKQPVVATTWNKSSFSK